jgi:hypothetical protein
LSFVLGGARQAAARSQPSTRHFQDFRIGSTDQFCFEAERGNNFNDPRLGEGAPAPFFVAVRVAEAAATK